jgi:hypothetical protein
MTTLSAPFGCPGVSALGVATSWSEGVHVDAVLGLSMTPTSVGLVLVEGHEADGATVDHEAIDIDHGSITTSEQATAAVLRTEAIAATRGIRLHSIGVTWSEDADHQASLLMRSLSESGFDNVVPIRLPEATEALARGMADVIGYQTTAVCVIEPETVITLIVHSGGSANGSVQTAFNHAVDTDQSLISWLSSVFTKADWQPEALVVVGSAGNFDELLPRLEDALSVPVFSPAEAELALARGAALASTRAVELPFAEFGGFDQPAEPAEPRWSDARRRAMAHNGALTMLVVGVVTFVASVSAAFSLEFSPHEQPATVDSVRTADTREAPAAAREAARPALPPPPAAIPTAIPAAPVLPPPQAPPVEVEAPVSDVPAEAPSYVDNPAAVPDDPAAALGPDPAAAPPPYVPPVAVPAPVVMPTKKPLHTRIMDRIRGVNDPDPDEFAPPVPPPAPMLPADAPPVPPVQ